MFTSFNKALFARHQALVNGEKGQKGFTLIELLVVVLIIGVLAAIAIPIYLGQQQAARDSAVEAQLTNAKTAIVAQIVTADGTATLPATEAAIDGFTPSADIPVTISGDLATGFCLTATHRGGGAAFEIRDTGAVQPGDCS